MYTLIKEKVIKLFHTVVTSTEHAEPLNALRSKEVAGNAGLEEMASSMQDTCKWIGTRSFTRKNHKVHHQYRTSSVDHVRRPSAHVRPAVRKFQHR